MIRRVGEMLRLECEGTGLSGKELQARFGRFDGEDPSAAFGRALPQRAAARRCARRARSCNRRLRAPIARILRKSRNVRATGAIFPVGIIALSTGVYDDALICSS